MRLLKLNKVKTKSTNKYGAIKKTVDGIVFASTLEADRYVILKVLLRTNKIKDLKLQVRYTFVYEGKKICSYLADFTYTVVETDLFIVNDSKGWDKKKKKFRTTEAYRIKKKMMKAFFNIDILET